MRIKQIVKKGIVSILPEGIKYEINRKNTEFAKYAYGQHGEDLVLESIFLNQPTGFYVDIGAHHPIRFSNTYKFYQKGWRGINIDAMPGSMEPFEKMRPEDINLEIPISNNSEVLTFYVFEHPAINTFSEEIVQGLAQRNIHHLETVKLETKKLSTVLEEYLPETQGRIDFCSIDVEGLDLEVLQSNNWEKFRPSIILVEIYFYTLEELVNSDIFLFLTNLDYDFHSKIHNTVIFRNKFGISNK